MRIDATSVAWVMPAQGDGDRDALNAGRALGLTIDVHPGSGWLSRSYLLEVSGPESTIRRWLAWAKEVMGDDSD